MIKQKDHLEMNLCFNGTSMLQWDPLQLYGIVGQIKGHLWPEDPGLGISALGHLFLRINILQKT